MGFAAFSAVENVLIGDPIVPSQFYSPTTKCEGEKLLMLAILGEAQQCLRGNADGARSIDDRDREQCCAYRWIMSNEYKYIFSFRRICAVFDVDENLFRNQLRMIYEANRVNTFAKRRSRNRFNRRVEKRRMVCA